MKRESVLATILLAVATVVHAADTLVVTKSGVWVLSITGDTPTLVKYAGEVIRLDGGTNPTDPTTPETFGAKVTKITDDVVDANKKNTKVALAQLYKTTASIPVADVAQLNVATNTIFNALNLPQAWKDWKAKVDEASKPYTTLDSARKAWVIIAQVLEKE